MTSARLGGVVNMRLSTLVLIAVSLAVVRPARADIRYTIIDLGTFGGDRSWASGINDSGQVTGRSHNASGDYRAFLYDGTMTDLGTLGGDISYGRGINDSGQVVGFAQDASGRQRAFLYDGTMTDLGTLGGEYSDAYDVNNLGQVVGYSSNAAIENRAFLYESGTMTDLGTFGGNSSEAKGINNSGQVVGFAKNASGQERAFLYESGAMQDLGTLGGASHANDINDSGHVVGSAYITSGKQHAFLYKSGNMQDLGTLGGRGSTASSINNSGQVVGWAHTASDVNHAYIYESGTMTDLNDLLDSGSGWDYLCYAYDINDKGQIVGYGNTTGGKSHAFLMTPVPVPSTISSMADGDWAVAGTWDAGGPVPTENDNVIINDHLVTVGGTSAARSVSLEHEQATLRVESGAFLDVGDEIAVKGGTLDLRGSAFADTLQATNGTLHFAEDGVLDVSDSMTLTDSRFAVDINRNTGSLVLAQGVCELGAGNSLVPQATESLALGDHFITLINSFTDGGVVGTFSSEPTWSWEKSLGFGVFYEEVAYPGESVELHVFQAIAGDIDGNRAVNGFDIASILAANMFGKPLAAVWSDGDYTGDGFVNGFDIQAILAANQFGRGPYASADPTGGGVNAVPEPSTVALLLSGLLALLWFGWRRRRTVA